VELFFLFRKPAAFDYLSTFFFEKKVAKKQKSSQDLSAPSVLLFAKTSCAFPSGNFAKAKFTRNNGAFLRFADFLWSANWCTHIIQASRAYSAICRTQKICEAFPRLAVPPNFCEVRAKITSGERRSLSVFFCTDKAIKRHVFPLL